MHWYQLSDAERQELIAKAECPHCNAVSGLPCTTKKGRGAPDHHARVRAACDQWEKSMSEAIRRASE